MVGAPTYARWTSRSSEDARPDDLRYCYREPPLILYLDTSGLVKLLIDEPGSTELLTESRKHTLATSVVAYAETCAAAAQAWRARRIDQDELTLAIQDSEQLWPDLQRIQATEGLMQQAGGLAVELGLRGYDAVHLASALTATTVEAVVLATWDRQLSLAAQSKGLQVFS